MYFTHNIYEESDSFDPLSVVETDELSPSAMEVHNFNPHDSSSHQVVSFNSSLPDSSYTTSPDLLALYHMSNPSPAASFLPISSGAFGNTHPLSFAGGNPVADAASASSVVCDPLFYLNLPPQPPPFRDLFQSLPATGYSLFGDEQIEAAGGGMYGEEQVGDGVMDFGLKLGKRRKGGKGTKQFVNDRERRVQVKDTYEVLRNLVPKPSKKDRASIVADAIKYIKELIASVNDLKMLVEKKRCAKARNKRLKAEEDSTENGIESSCVTKPGLIADTDQASFNNGSSLRSSWVHRKSKDTEVDVRIIDDEVTIKLVQRKRMNRNLLYVSKILDELQLDLHHVAGGHVGDYYSYLFNTKINEGSCVYASGIANRIMDMVEGPNASTPTTSCS